MPEDAKPADEGIVVPSTPAVEPLPGQPEPEATSTPAGTEEVKTVPLAALHEERDKRQELQAELAALKQIAGNNVLFDINGNPVQAPSPQSSNTPIDSGNKEFVEQLDKAWEDDPRKAVEMTVASALQWKDGVDQQVDMQEMETEGKYADFNAYRGDVRKYVRTLPIEQRGSPGVVEMAYFVIKGQKSGNVYQSAQAELLEKIRKGEQVAGLPASAPAAPQKGLVLSQDQIKVADAMGLTPEQYASAMVTK